MPVDTLAIPMPSRSTRPVIWVSVVLRSTFATRTVLLLSAAPAVATFYQFHGLVATVRSGLAPRCACRPDPARLHLGFPSALEAAHGTFRRDRLARHDDSLCTQERPGRGGRRRPGLDGPDGGQVECPQIAAARRRRGDRGPWRHHRRRQPLVRAAR